MVIVEPLIVVVVDCYYRCPHPDCCHAPVGICCPIVVVSAIVEKVMLITLMRKKSG